MTRGRRRPGAVTLPRRRRRAPPRRPCASSRRGSSAAARALPRARREVARAPGTVPYLGERSRSCPSRAARACTAAATCCSSRRRTPRPALERWYRRQARAEIAPRLDAAARRAGTRYSGADHPRPAHALGVVLGERRDVVQLAPAARARGGARLRRRARGLPPRGDGPLAALLGAAGVARARLARARRAGCAATARRWCSDERAAQRRVGRLAAPRGSISCAPDAPGPRLEPSRRRARRPPPRTPGPRSSTRPRRPAAAARTCACAARPPRARRPAASARPVALDERRAPRPAAPPGAAHPRPVADRHPPRHGGHAASRYASPPRPRRRLGPRRPGGIGRPSRKPWASGQPLLGEEARAAPRSRRPRRPPCGRAPRASSRIAVTIAARLAAARARRAGTRGRSSASADRHLAQPRQRGVAGAEVVEREPQAERRAARAGSARRRRGPRMRRRLGQLDGQARRVGAGRRAGARARARRSRAGAAGAARR